MAAVNLKGSAPLECTPVTSRLVQFEFEKQVEWTPGQCIEEDKKTPKKKEKARKKQSL